MVLELLALGLAIFGLANGGYKIVDGISDLYERLKGLKGERGGIGYGEVPRGRVEKGDVEQRRVYQPTGISSTSIGYEGSISQLYNEVTKRRSKWNPIKRWRYGREAKKYAEKTLKESVEEEKENWRLTIEKRGQQARLRMERANLENLVAEMRKDGIDYGTAYRRLKEQEGLLYELVNDLGLMGVEILQQVQTNSPSPMNVRASYEKLNVRLPFEHLIPMETERYLSRLREIIQSYIRGEEVTDELVELIERTDVEKEYYSQCVNEVGETGESIIQGETGVHDAGLHAIQGIITDYQERISDIDTEMSKIDSTVKEIKDNEYRKRKESEEFEKLRLGRELALWTQDLKERERMRGHEITHVKLVEKLDDLGKQPYTPVWELVPEEKKEETPAPESKPQDTGKDSN